MKWISKDKKSSLDLDKIGYWQYISLEDAKKQNSYLGNETNRLKVFIGGCDPVVFRGEDADEIYEMLINKKEII